MLSGLGQSVGVLFPVFTFAFTFALVGQFVVLFLGALCGLARVYVAGIWIRRDCRSALQSDYCFRKHLWARTGM